MNCRNCGKEINEWEPSKEICLECWKSVYELTGDVQVKTKKSQGCFPKYTPIGEIIQWAKETGTGGKLIITISEPENNHRRQGMSDDYCKGCPSHKVNKCNSGHHWCCKNVKCVDCVIRKQCRFSKHKEN
jgi:hypothetical protein